MGQDESDGFGELTEWGKRRRSSLVDDHVRVYGSGRIAIPPAWLEDHFADADGVRLAVGEDPVMIGLKPADKSHPNAYTLQKENRRSAVVNCKAFLEEFGLLPEETTSYPTEWDEEDQYLRVVIDSTN